MTQDILPGFEPDEPVEPKIPKAKSVLDKPPAPQAVLRGRSRPCTCGAMITFAMLTKKVRGVEQTKPHPYDVEPDLAGTTHLVMEERGRRIVAYPVPKAERAGRTSLHRSHFDTCEHAEQWRKGGPDGPR